MFKYLYSIYLRAKYHTRTQLKVTAKLQKQNERTKKRFQTQSWVIRYDDTRRTTYIAYTYTYTW